MAIFPEIIPCATPLREGGHNTAYIVYRVLQYARSSRVVRRM